jgi:8-oxo-dGTP diphosphatase
VHRQAPRLGGGEYTGRLLTLSIKRADGKSIYCIRATHCAYSVYTNRRTDANSAFSSRPRPVDSAPLKRIEAAIALVRRGDKLLVCQRKAGDTLGGFWEFPGGKCEDGETLEQCLARELREELAIAARPVARLTTIEHDYPHVLLRLHPFVCDHLDGEVQHIECQASAWIDPPELRGYRFPPANESLIEEAIAWFARAAGTADLSEATTTDTISRTAPAGD